MSKSITDFYAKNTNKEWTRLERHPLEFPITYRHINEIIGNDKFVIADIGGGPGRYSIELSKSGNEVTLVDLTPENIEFAKNKANELNIPINNFIVGDARKLISLSDNRFDLTLLLGTHSSTKCNDVVQKRENCDTTNILLPQRKGIHR